MLYPSSYRHPLGIAKQAEAELENLSARAERNWPPRWHESDESLDDKLADFLVEGHEFATADLSLKFAPNAAIAKAIVDGIERSGTHDSNEIRRGLGLPEEE